MPNAYFLFKHPAHFLALGFGTGLAKFAPGTWGTLLGFPLFLCIAPFNIAVQIFAGAIFFAIGVYLCDVTGDNLGVPDHGSIVWDEIVGMAIVLIFTPFNWFWWLLAFILFRLFDIWKPFPIRQLDAKLKNGFGVMLDDLLAAVYAIATIHGITWILLQTLVAH